MFLEHWLEPVVGPARGAHRRDHAAPRSPWASSPPSPPWSASPRAAPVYLRRRVRAARARAVLAHAWYYDEAITRFVGGPGTALRGRRLVRPHVVDGAVNGVASWCAASAAGCATSSPASSAPTPWASATGVVVVLGYFLTRVPLLMCRTSRQRGRPRLADRSSIARSSCAAGAARWSSLLVPRPRAELHRGVALLFAAAPGRWRSTCWPRSSRDDAGYQFEVNRSWVADFGISWHVGIDGISLFLRRAHRRAVPDRPARRHAPPRRQAVLRLAAAARGRLPRRVRGRSTSSCSS